jgi:MFS family permease
MAALGLPAYRPSSAAVRRLTQQSPEATLDAYSAFRHRDYRLLITGTFLSQFGLQMLSVAVSWDLYVQTKSAVVLGNVGFVQVAPFLLFALFAGQAVDRGDRRRILIVTQMIFLAASALLIAGFHSIATIYACLFLAASARAFQWPARQATLPNLVPPELLSNAITWSSSSVEIAAVSGPAVAGLLIAWAGTRTVYLVQTVCATLTVLCYILLRYRTPPNPNPEPRTVKTLLEGMHFVRDNKLILSAISLDLFGVLFGGATALLPIYAVEILRVGVVGLGWLRAAPSIGAFSMAILTAHSPKPKAAGQKLLGAVAGFGTATVVFGLSRSFWLSLATLLLVGAFDNISVVLRQTLTQTHTPDRLKGRVFAVTSIFISSSNQFGAVESGWTAAWFGAVASVVGGGVATIAVVAICAAMSPQLRHWKQ